MQVVQGSEILIACGMHQFQHGRVDSIDTATEIPFAHIQLRGRSGDFLTRSGAYVPLKYCVILEAEVAAELAKIAKAARKVRRLADKAAEAAKAAAEVARGKATLVSIAWEP